MKSARKTQGTFPPDVHGSIWRAVRHSRRYDRKMRQAAAQLRARKRGLS